MPWPNNPDKFKILDLKTILDGSQDTTSSGDAAGSDVSLATQTPPISVEALPASLTGRASTIGSEVLKRCCAGLFENGIDAVSLRKRLDAGVNVMDPSIDPLLAKPIDVELSLDKRLSADSREVLKEVRRRIELLVKAHAKLFPGFDERGFDSVVNGVLNDEGIKEGGLRFKFIPRVCEKKYRLEAK